MYVEQARPVLPCRRCGADPSKDDTLCKMCRRVISARKKAARVR